MTKVYSFFLCQRELNITTPGMYSLILSAFDRAGNHKSTRSVFLYDNQSVVETVPDTKIIVKESAAETDYTWVTVDTNRLTVTWAGRFMNERHDIYKWCNEIGDSSHIEEVYDDRFGRRTVDWLTNVRGILYTITRIYLRYMNLFYICSVYLYSITLGKHKNCTTISN